MHNVFVLIACEESQIECCAFRAAGCLAFSCDIQPCSGGHPEWHIMGDALAILNGGCFHTQNGEVHFVPGWNLLIAHPPCTYLSRAASGCLFPGRHINWARFKMGLLARRFFMAFYDAPIRYVVVENPIPFRIFKLPQPTFAVNPYDFGSPWAKKTLYWCRNLPPLMCGVENPTRKQFVRSKKSSKARSKSFAEIAAAMVSQWLPIINP